MAQLNSVVMKGVDLTPPHLLIPLGMSSDTVVYGGGKINGTTTGLIMVDHRKFFSLEPLLKTALSHFADNMGIGARGIHTKDAAILP